LGTGRAKKGVRSGGDRGREEKAGSVCAEGGIKTGEILSRSGSRAGNKVEVFSGHGGLFLRFENGPGSPETEGVVGGVREAFER